MPYSIFSMLIVFLVFFVAFVLISAFIKPRLKIKRDYVKNKDSVFGNVLKDLKDVKAKIKD